MPTAPDWVEGDLNQVTSDQLKNHDALFHFAAYGVGDPVKADWEQCFRVNVTDSLRLWLRAHEAGIKRYVICGSCFEYGKSGERFDFIPTTAPLEPTSAYHASKAAASMAAFGLAVDKSIELCILRPFHTYGEGEPQWRFWPSLKRAALADEDFQMTAGEQVRDFIDVDDVAKIFLNAAERGDLQPGNPVIENVGSGQPLNMLSFAKYWWSHWQAKGDIHAGAISYRDHEVMRYVPNISSH